MVGNKYRFSQFDKVGAAGAEDDEFLSECFIDTGYLHVIKDMDDCRSIILGRTGAGKSALIEKINEDEKERTIVISPENLALSYVSNSTILSFFSSIGVNLDPFFKLLWRHVLTVEVLAKHFETDDNSDKKSVREKVTDYFRSLNNQDKKSREAIDYLHSWGSSFWEETEYRVKEITKTVEDQLSDEMKLKLGVSGVGVELGSSTSQTLKHEEKQALHERGQRIVSRAQVQDLTKVIHLLDTVLSDRQKKYYIVIDKLDENWVEESLRYKLIMALIVTAKELSKVSNAKVIISMRRDLIDRVFRFVRDSGFQEEKFESLFLPLVWTGNELIELLDKRIDRLIKSKYTSQIVTHRDLLPKKMYGLDISDYMVEMVRRPRDIIDFFNHCIISGNTLSKLTVEKLKEAEGAYSRGRVKALGDEWSADYPSLLDFLKILQNRSQSFKVSTINDSSLEDLCLIVAANDLVKSGELKNTAASVINGTTDIQHFKMLLASVFYRVGLVGIKLNSHSTCTWVDRDGHSISTAEITDECSLVIHPMYYRALGVKVSF